MVEYYNHVKQVYMQLKGHALDQGMIKDFREKLGHHANYTRQ
jgi:hypothetical protein